MKNYLKTCPITGNTCQADECQIWNADSCGLICQPVDLYDLSEEMSRLTVAVQGLARELHRRV